MRVLIIAQYFPPDMGGGATRAFNVAKGLLLNGCSVTVVTAFPHYPNGDIPRAYRWRVVKIEWVDGLRVIRTFVPPIASKGLIRRMILFLSFMTSSLLAIPLVGKVDVVWASNPNVLSFIPALIFGLVKGSPVALNVDDLWPEDLYMFGLLRKGSVVSKVAELLARFTYHRADAVTPISSGYVDIISSKYGVNLEKVYVVRAGVDTSKFKPKDEKPNDSNGFIVLYSGAFSVAYDFDQVLKAAKLLEEYGDVKIVLQGGGEMLNHIKNRIAEMSVRNVKVMDKILSRKEVAELLSGADALLLPLRDFGKPYLGISSKLYEYQAVGKPIICCGEGQPAEYVKETGSGVVVKPGDFEALAKSILYLKENRDVAEKMGATGRRYVEKNLTIEKIGLRMREIFETLIDRRVSET
ncbi:MAG: glycosyltransferase family 4 protein [Candidatus Bathyarchaeia archaeon]